MFYNVLSSEVRSLLYTVGVTAMAMVIVLGLVFVPLFVLAAIACVCGDNKLFTPQACTPTPARSAGCHGVTGGYKATRKDLSGRDQVMSAGGYWSV